MNQAARLVQILPPPTAPAPQPVQRLPLVAHGDELGPNGRRWLIGGVLVAHLAGGWALLQVDVVRQTVTAVAPATMVDMVAPEPPRLAPPPPARPVLPQHRPAPAPLPLVAAAPSPAQTPTAIAVPPVEPAPPAPVVLAPAPPAPPAPPPVQAPPPAPVLKRIPGTALRYLRQPRLNFPLLSRRANESGEVVLRIVVDADGRLKDAWVQQTSGFARIDQAALQDIRSARFAPYLEDGKPVDVETTAVLAYDLDR